MAKDRREPIGDGPDFSEATASRSSLGKSATRASLKRRPASPRSEPHEFPQPESGLQGSGSEDSDPHRSKRATAKRSSAERSSTLGEAHAAAPLHPDFRPPEPGTLEAIGDDDQPVRPISRDVWVTKDGRELTIKEMYRPHLGNAQAVLSVWLKREKDPVKRRELKSWRSKMRRELVKREKAWQAKRKKQADGSS